MAGKTRGKSSEEGGKNRKERVAFKGYLNFTVTEEIKRAYSASVRDGRDAERYIPDYEVQGYTFKRSYDGYNQSAVATVFAQGVDMPDAGWCYSVRAANSSEALSRLVFILTEVLAGSLLPLLDSKEAADW